MPGEGDGPVSTHHFVDSNYTRTEPCIVIRPARKLQARSTAPGSRIVTDSDRSSVEPRDGGGSTTEASLK